MIDRTAEVASRGAQCATSESRSHKSVDIPRIARSYRWIVALIILALPVSHETAFATDDAAVDAARRAEQSQWKAARRAEQPLWDAARNCSLDKVRLYAGSSNAAAEHVAEAAFDECGTLWRRAVGPMARRWESTETAQLLHEECVDELKSAGMECESPPVLLFLIDQARKDFVRDAVTVVSNIRRSKAPK